MNVSRAALWLPMSIALTLACVPGAAAQPAAQPPSSGPQGLSMNGDQPVRIVSNTLEVRDKSRQAIFSGDVKLVQGDTTITCQTLIVFYEDTAAPTKKSAPQAGAAPPKSGQRIKRAEARGEVFVVQKEQTASGDNAVFDVKSNTVVMTGSVVVTQGKMVTRGDRMVSNLTSGVTSVTSNSDAAASSKKPAKQIEVLIEPGAKDAKASLPAPAPAAPAPAPPPASAKAAPKGPLRLN